MNDDIDLTLDRDFRDKRLPSINSSLPWEKREVSYDNYTFSSIDMTNLIRTDSTYTTIYDDSSTFIYLTNAGRYQYTTFIDLKENPLYKPKLIEDTSILPWEDKEDDLNKKLSPIPWLEESSEPLMLDNGTNISYTTGIIPYLNYSITSNITSNVNFNIF